MAQGGIRDVLGLQGVFLCGYARREVAQRSVSGGGGGTYQWYEPCGSTYFRCSPELLEDDEAPSQGRPAADEPSAEPVSPSVAAGPDLALDSSLGSVSVSLPTLLAGGAAVAAWGMVGKRKLSAPLKFVAGVASDLLLEKVRPAVRVTARGRTVRIAPWGQP